jgi:hypothetical protein
MVVCFARTECDRVLAAIRMYASNDTGGPVEAFQIMTFKYAAVGMTLMYRLASSECLMACVLAPVETPSCALTSSRSPSYAATLRSIQQLTATCRCQVIHCLKQVREECLTRMENGLHQAVKSNICSSKYHDRVLRAHNAPLHVPISTHGRLRGKPNHLIGALEYTISPLLRLRQTPGPPHRRPRVPLAPLRNVRAVNNESGRSMSLLRTCDEAELAREWWR